MLFGNLGPASPSLRSRLELVFHLAALAFNGEAGLGLAGPVVSFFPEGCHLGSACTNQYLKLFKSITQTKYRIMGF